MGAWPTPYKYALSHMLSCQMWLFSIKRGSDVITEMRWKFLTRRVPPFSVIQGHWNRHGSIGYL